MTWWLSVFFLVNGVWIPGSDFGTDGWGPRAYVTEQACVERKEFAEKQCREFPLESTGLSGAVPPPDPLLDVPDDLRGVEC